MSRNIINDGYTTEGYIEAAEGLHDELSFRYRPMLPEDVEATDAEVNRRTDSKKTVHLFVAQVQRHLVDWSEVDDKGTAVPITFENVRRLGYVPFNRLYMIISGQQATDLRPGATDKEGKNYADAIIAEAGGEPVSTTDADEKN